MFKTILHIKNNKKKKTTKKISKKKTTTFIQIFLFCFILKSYNLYLFAKKCLKSH